MINLKTKLNKFYQFIYFNQIKCILKFLTF